MTTSQIVWTIVIVAAVLILIGLVVASMRKKSLADNRARATQLRDRADTRAAGLPDAEARAEQAEAHAEHAHLEAQRADEHAATARAAADQERALQEDQIRAADRLDPDVDHRAKDYSPEVVAPAGPSDVPVDPTYADPATGRATQTSSDSATVTDESSPAAGGSSVTLEPTDTSPRDETVGADDATLRDRLEGTPDEQNAGGTHRA
jgi:FtsZ-interacting cell division protein ZipA